MIGTWKWKNGWKVKFSLDGFIWLINFGNKKIKLQLSDQLRFPSLSGWFKFKYLKAWYYIRINGKSLKFEW